MFKVSMQLRGSVNIDHFEVDAECPRCHFHNPIWIRQARLRDVVICRGCKANIQLDDRMNTVRKARESVNRAFQGLQDVVKQFNR